MLNCHIFLSYYNSITTTKYDYFKMAKHKKKEEGQQQYCSNKTHFTAADATFTTPTAPEQHTSQENNNKGDNFLNEPTYNRRNSDLKMAAQGATLQNYNNQLVKCKCNTFLSRSASSPSTTHASPLFPHRQCTLCPL